MNNDLLTVSFVGDIMCLKEQNKAILDKYGEYYYDELFSEVKQIFSESDYIVGNLETPISSFSVVSDYATSFNTPPQFLKSLKTLGVNLVSTANNHCLDRGINGVFDTIDNLDKEKIAHIGTYKSQFDRDQIYVKDLDGVKIAFISYTYGTNSEINGNILNSNELWAVNLLKTQNKKSRIQKTNEDISISRYIIDNVPPVAIGNLKHKSFLNNLKSDIIRAKEQADKVIVLPHIGGQYNPAPGAYSKYIVNFILEAGADAVIATHPHVPLRITKVNSKLCAFSLGNFTFTPGVGYFLPNTLSEYGIVLHIHMDKNTKEILKVNFSVVVNHVDEDGISRVYPIDVLYNKIQSSIEKDRMIAEVEAVVNRVRGRNDDVIISRLYEL